VAINLIVLAVTFLVAAFSGAWVFLPRVRSWMEAPKHRFHEQQRRFPGVDREHRADSNVGSTHGGSS
jgi:hypothetical protein